MSASDAYVEIRCQACKAPEQVPAAASELNCPNCGAHHRFLLCPVCHETEQVDDKVGRPRGRSNTTPTIGCTAVSSWSA